MLRNITLIIAILSAISTYLTVSAEELEPYPTVINPYSTEDDQKPNKFSIKNTPLPDHAQAPKGKLSLFADFNDIRGEFITLYLINRTNKWARFSSQDWDIYVKQEFKDKDDKWVRAQPHKYSWCGNSYDCKRALKPEEYFVFSGIFPTNGIKKEIRYKRYQGDNQVISNSGFGYVLPDNIEEAAQDRMNFKSARTKKHIDDFDSIVKTALGPDKYTSPDKIWNADRSIAIGKLLRERYDKKKVIPVLKMILEKEKSTRAPEQFKTFQDYLVTFTESILKRIEKPKKPTRSFHDLSYDELKDQSGAFEKITGRQIQQERIDKWMNELKIKESESTEDE